MKTRLLSLLAASAAVLAVPAGAEDLILPDEKADGYAVMDLWYSTFDNHGLDLKGGGMHIGGEYVDPGLLFGIGGRVGYGFYFGSKDKEAGYTVDEKFAFDLMGDVYVPFRVSQFVTLYGGVGGTGITESWEEKRTVRGRRTVYEATDDVSTSGFPVLFAAFGGIRVRYENVFFFAEYRKDFEKSVEFEREFDGTTRKEKFDRDIGCGRVLVGLGLEFGKANPSAY